MILVLHQEDWFYPLFPTRITMILVKDSLYLSLPTTIRIMVWASSKSYRNEQQNQDLPRHNTIQYNTIQCNLFWFSGRIPCCDPNWYALYSHIWSSSWPFQGQVQFLFLSWCDLSFLLPVYKILKPPLFLFIIRTYYLCLSKNPSLQNSYMWSWCFI